MSEPASVTASALAYKYGAMSGFVLLAAVAVMAMTRPRSTSEWMAALCSTVAGSLGGGSAVVMHFGLDAWVSHGAPGIMATGGVLFLCGLPAWVLVRAWFVWADNNRKSDVFQIVAKLREALKQG